MGTGKRAKSEWTWIVSGLLIAALARVSPAELVRWSAAEGGNDHFYQAVLIGEPISWADANRLAQSLGGHLVTMTSQAEDDFVFRLIDDGKYWYRGVNLRGPWIGAYQPEGSPEPDGNWRWVTGEPFEYTNWDVGQPNNSSGLEHYAAFGNQPNRVPRWNDLRVDYPEIIAFVVEYSDPNRRPVPWPASRGGNRHFYLPVSAPGGLSWDRAEVLAEMAGGYLATITGAEENAFVFSLIQDPVYWNGPRGPWLGGYQLPGRPLREGWQWVTGEPFVYANWSPGQPNDSGGVDETRLEFGWGAATIADTWNDQPDWWTGVYSFVLEVDTSGSALAWPDFGRIDYNDPNACLTLPACLGSGRMIQALASQVRGATALETLSQIESWRQTHLTLDQSRARTWQSLDSMAKSGTYGGDAALALAAGALARGCGIPTVWVKAMDNDWIAEYQSAGAGVGDCRGHVFLEVFIDNRWMLLDPAPMTLYCTYNPASHALPGRRYAYDKGDDPEALILPMQYDLWKQQALVYFEDFDLSELEASEPAPGLPLGSIATWTSCEPAWHTSLTVPPSGGTRGRRISKSL